MGVYHANYNYGFFVYLRNGSVDEYSIPPVFEGFNVYEQMMTIMGGIGKGNIKKFSLSSFSGDKVLSYDFDTRELIKVLPDEEKTTKAKKEVDDILKRLGRKNNE